MSLDLGTMYALVTLDDAEYKKKLGGLERASTDSFEKIAKAAAAYLSLRAVTGFVRSTVGMYSDLEEETNKFNVVFAGMGERTSQVLAQMRKDFGLSELSAKRMLAGTGDMLTGFGFDPKLALVLSEGAAKLGADIASFSNYAGGAAGATTALTKAMLGEAESAKLLGVVIKQDSEEMKALKEQALTTGITIEALGDAGKNIIVSNENQAKAVAALALAYQQSPNAIGDFKRSQDSIANQTRILENNFEELTSKIGGDLAPAYRDTLGLANDLIRKYNELSPASRMLINNTVALTAAMAALGTTKIGRSIMTFKGNSAEDIEAAKTQATENVKRAETRMTTAQLEKDLASQNLSLAKNAVAAAENAVAFARAEKAKADASGDTARMLKAATALSAAESNLAKAKLDEAKATSDLTAKTSALNAATAEYNTLSSQLPAVLSSIAATATFAGNASIFLSGGFKAAAVAAKTFFASIGPIGWAILALGGAFAVGSALMSSYNQKLEENAKKTGEAADGAAKENEKMRQSVKSQLSAAERLSELSKYERLSNAEREEAQKILKDLGIAYDENGKSVDEMISRNGKETKSLKELIAAKKEQLKQERIAKLREEIDRQRTAIDANDEKKAGFWGSMFKSDEAIAKEDADIDAENQKRYDAITKAREEIRKLQEEGVKGERNIAKEAQDTRRALESLTDTEWNIKFNSSDLAEQADILNQKIQGILSQQSGKYANVDAFVNADRHKMNEQEIKDLEKIIELEGRRAEIEKQSAEEYDRELESYTEMLNQRFKQQQDKRLEKEISEAEKNGDSEQARAIMERELASARKAAQQMEREYLSALEMAQEDDAYTAEERKRVEDLKRKWQESLSDQDKWQSRIDSKGEKESKKMQETIGAWSFELLASQLGANKPEIETAKNTKRTKELLEDIKENLTTGEVTYQ